MTGLPWHIVEAAILREKQWLISTLDFAQERKNIEDISSFTDKLSRDEMLRRISISIVNGNIRAREIKSKSINGLWTDDFRIRNWQFGSKDERHGGEWHRAMMTLIKKYFIEEGYDVINEPYLTLGRADLGVYREGETNIYIEIGTTTLLKTWINLHTIQHSTFLFVPSVYRAAEFITQITRPL